MSDTRWNDWEMLCGALAAILAGISLGIVEAQTPLRMTLQQPLYELGMSDLVGGINASLVNGVGHILAGALLVCAALAHLRAPDRRHIGAVAALLLAGIFWAALGITPARYGDEQAMVIHGIWMVGFQLTATATLLMLARRQTQGERVAQSGRRLLFVLGAALVLASVLAGLRGLPVPGLLERIGIGAFFACMGFQSYGLWRAKSAMTPHTALR